MLISFDLILRILKSTEHESDVVQIQKILLVLTSLRQHNIVVTFRCLT
jgi:hypothetical protein